MPDGLVGTPDVRDAERLQGFPADWTVIDGPVTTRRAGARWKMVGNAVCVPVAQWVGERLTNPGTFDDTLCHPLQESRWPMAAWGDAEGAFTIDVSPWPLAARRPHLVDFLRYPVRPLSVRATGGFLSRAERSSLRFPDGFLDAVRRHLKSVGRSAA
jgi:DNA (cytosine-5)-methyltransferase 1